jgi:type IV pilus assembly protein PilW
MSTTSLSRRATRGQLQKGLSLIELMVALLISAVISLAIFGVMSTFEGRKRTSTAMNDTNQAGSYGMYLLDRYIRSAGSGFVQAGPEPRIEDARKAMAFGCRLLVSKSGGTVLPKGSAFDPPFENIDPTGTAGTLRLAPVIVVPSRSHGLGFSGERSDVLLVMSGTGGFGEVPISLTAPAGASVLPVSTGQSLASGDLLLLADQKAPTLGTTEDCMIQQIQPAYTGGSNVDLSGDYAATAMAGVSAAIYDENSVVMKLGHPTLNPPNFFAIGVADNGTLQSYDLLQTRSPALQALADNVFELHAMYGVDTDGNGIVEWVDPRTTTGDFALANLMDGSAKAANSISLIKALRLALVVRANLREKDDDNTSTPASFTLFNDIGMPRVRTLTDEQRRYRYRVIEQTIPLRNSILAPKPA